MPASSFPYGMPPSALEMMSLTARAIAAATTTITIATKPCGSQPITEASSAETGFGPQIPKANRSANSITA